MLTELASRFRAFFRSGSLDADFDEELHSHLDLLTGDNIRKGMEPGEARRVARLTLGGAAQLREAHREARGLPLLESLLRDTKYAARSLRKTPGFAAAAILTLGIGIGANTAIFSAIDETLFRPPDFPHPEQLADIFAFNKSSQTFVSGSYPDYADFRARATTFQQISAFLRMPMNIALNGTQSERLPVEAVTGNFFSLLEMPPAAGRIFRDDDDSPAAHAALLSEEIAGADSIGRQILIEDQPFTVVGIVPRRYHGTNLNWGDPPRVWIPLRAIEIVQPRFRALNIFRQRAMAWLLMVGRLKPGVDITRAQAEIQTIAAGIASNEPKSNRDLTAFVFSAARSKFWPAYRASITQSLTVFAAAAALVLLLACANLSSLLLSRAVTRQREFAIRLSVGASRGRLVRQLLTESLLLAAPGCLAALALAQALGRILAHFPNALGLPLALDGSIEHRVLFFCIALSIAATTLFALVPALQSTRPAVLAGRQHNRLRNSLLALQVAFTMILLVAGGLFERSVLRAWSVDLGFRGEGLLTAAFPIPAVPGPEPLARMRRSQEDLVERLRFLSQVQSVTLAMHPPLDPLHTKSLIETTGLTVDRQEIGSGYFHTLGIPLLSGREFDIRDNETAPKVAIVNRSLATFLGSGASPLGRAIRTMNQTYQIVGVASDSRFGSVWEDPQPSLYLALSQSTSPRTTLIVRGKGNPADLASLVSGEWNAIAPHTPLYDFKTVHELLNVALAPQRMAAWVFGAFGLIAVALASVGLYSSVSYAVARRSREIGIRLAIGATPSLLMRQILARSMLVAGAGLVAGLIVSVLLARFIASLVKGVSVYDTATFVLVALLLGTAALLATAIPARRAGRIDPQIALRME